MKVRATIKAGAHAPAFLARLRHFRFWIWPFRRRTHYHISEVRIWAVADFPRALDAPTGHGLGYPLTILDGQQLTQINKVGGLAWGLPRRLKYGFKGHANSNRLGFDLAGGFYSYRYDQGDRDYAQYTPDLDCFEGSLPQGHKPWVAYSLGPYIGGTETLPFDILIEYNVTYW